jgi:hypothetical protein
MSFTLGVGSEQRCMLVICSLSFSRVVVTHFWVLIGYSADTRPVIPLISGHLFTLVGISIYLTKLFIFSGVVKKRIENF